MFVVSKEFHVNVFRDFWERKKIGWPIAKKFPLTSLFIVPYSPRTNVIRSHLFKGHPDSRDLLFALFMNSKNQLMLKRIKHISGFCVDPSINSSSVNSKSVVGKIMSEIWSNASKWQSCSQRFPKAKALNLFLVLPYKSMNLFQFQFHLIISTVFYWINWCKFAQV